MRRRAGVARSNASFRKGLATGYFAFGGRETPSRDPSEVSLAHPASPKRPGALSLWPVPTRGLTRFITRQGGDGRAPHNPPRGIEQNRSGLCRARLTRRWRIEKATRRLTRRFRSERETQPLSPYPSVQPRHG